MNLSIPTNPREPTAQAWDMQPGESAWYGRFLLYCSLGPARTLEAAYALEKGRGAKQRRLPNTWKLAAERFNWRQRALAWDEPGGTQPPSPTALQELPGAAQPPAPALAAQAPEPTGDELEAMGKLARMTIRRAAVRAAQTLVDMLDEGDPGKRRLAAVSVLSWSGLLPGGGEEKETVERIRVIDFEHNPPPERGGIPMEEGSG